MRRNPHLYLFIGALLALGLLITSSAPAALAATQTPLNEPFDDSTQFSTSTPFFSDGNGDYFGISDGAAGGDFGAGTVPSALKPYTGFTGSFLTGMDMDGEGATLPITVEWTGINIAGLTDLNFSGDFAEFFDTPGDIDEAGELILVEYQIDGNGYNNLLQFVGADFDNPPFNGFFREDTDFDGIGDGLTLGSAAQSFTKAIAQTGTTMDLRLTVSVNAGDEDFAVDNFVISGDDGLDGDDAPAVSSTSPANGETGVAVDANIDVTFSEDVTVSGSWFTLVCDSSGSVSATVTGGPQTYTINPDSDLANGESCTLTVLAAQVADDDTVDPPDNMDSDVAVTFTTMAAPSTSTLVIAEIMYNPSSSEDNWEWVEVYNAGTTAVDLTGYVLDDINSVAHTAANIATGAIPAGETAVLYNADDITASDFTAAWGGGINLIAVTNWGAMALNNGGDTVSLWSDFASYSGDHTIHANAIVTVPYDDDGTVWPLDDGNASIFLTDLTADATDGTNWALSIVGGATPTFTGYQSVAGGGNSGEDVGSPGDPQVELIISEIMYNPASAEDDWEWIEIVNNSIFTVDLAGYVIDDINSTAHGAANIAAGTLAPFETAVFYNADDVTEADFKAAWGADVNTIAVTNWGAMGLNNGGDTVSLWSDFASYSGDHTIHANAIVTVAYDDDGTNWPSDDGNASIYLTDLAADANVGANWALSTDGGVTPAFTGFTSNPLGGNSGADVGSPGPVPPPAFICGEPATLISFIQGGGPASAEEGNVHVIEGVVVGDFQGANELNGFYVQEEDGDQDGDLSTSEGIFVYDPGFTVDVAVGDVVRVAGEVDEFFGATQLGFVSQVALCSSGATVTPATLSFPFGSEAELEAVEGMAVTIPQAMTVTDSFNLHRFGEMVIANGRQYIPTNNVTPPTNNANNRIILDDGSTVALNSANAPIPYLGVDNTVRLGDTAVNITGVMGFAFGSYRLHPTDVITFARTNPRPAAPTDFFGTDLTIASVNVLNYFTTIDDGNNNARGADSAAEFVRQQDKIVAQLLTLDADVVGLQEIENNGDTAVAALIDALNAATAPSTWAFVSDPAYPGGLESTNAIKVAIIYQTASVTPIGPSVADDDPVFAEDRPPVAQTFMTNEGDVFTVIVNHFKSKGCSGATGADTDQGDGQGCYNARRVAMADALLDFVTTMQAISGDDDVVVLGDMNAYAEEDPILALETGLVNQIDKYVSDAEKYSFVFFGESGQLDHMFTTASLDANVTGAEIWHINSDEPRALSYNDDVIDPSEGSSNLEQESVYAPDPYRSSDHDPLILSLRFGAPINADGCFVFAIVGSPYTGNATMVEYTSPNEFNLRRWLGQKPQKGEFPYDHCYEIHGTDASERIKAWQSDDVIFGYDGDDTMFGYKGNDTFIGGPGEDFFIGGSALNSRDDTVLDYEAGLDRCRSVENGCD